MNHKLRNFVKKIEMLVALFFLLYILTIVFIINIPIKIFELWKDLKWWAFVLLSGFIIYSVYCFLSVLITDYIREISKKTKKIISSVLGILILTFLAGIFNFKHDNSIIVFVIFIPMVLIFYFSLNIKLNKLTDFSYKKGWFDGYKDKITGYYGKSYEDGVNDGINFNKENKKNTNHNV